MQLNIDALHGFFDVVSLIGVVGAAWGGLLIKNALWEMKDNQATVKADLIAAQTKAKEEIADKYAKLSMELSSHLARDDEQFRSVNKTLDRIEGKIDRNGKAT